MSSHQLPELEIPPQIAFEVSQDAVAGVFVTGNMPDLAVTSGLAAGLTDRIGPYGNDVALISGSPTENAQIVRAGFTLPQEVDLSGSQVVGFAMGYTGENGPAMGEDVNHRFYLSNEVHPSSGLPATYSSTALNFAGSKQQNQFFALDRTLFSVNQGAGFDWDQPCRSIIVDMRSVADPPATIECFFKFFCHGWKWKNNKVPLMMSFDDAAESQITAVRPKLLEHNMKASFGITSSLIDANERMTGAQLRQLIDEGFEVVNHYITNTAATGLTKDQQAAEFDGCAAAIKAEGVDNYEDRFLVHVQGQWNDDSIDMLNERGVKFARSATNPLPHRLETCGLFGRGGLNPQSLRAFNLQETDLSTAALVLAEVDDAISLGMPVLLMGHLVITSAVTATEFELSEWNTLVDGLATRNLISVNMCEYLYGETKGLPISGILMKDRTDNGDGRVFIDGGTTSRFAAWGTWDTATLTVEVSPDALNWTTAVTFTADGNTPFEVGPGTYVRASLSSVGGSTSVSCRAIS